MRQGWKFWPLNFDSLSYTLFANNEDVDSFNDFLIINNV